MEPISVASGASYFLTPEPVKQAAVYAIRQNQTFYGPAEGLLSLRSAIASRYYDNLDRPATPDQVLITHGARLALHTIFSVLLPNDGDEVLIPAPYWFGFTDLVKISRGKLVPLYTASSENFKLTPEALRKAITAKTRILVLSNPNNPTGYVYNSKELRDLLKVLSDYPEVYILADEIYDQIHFGERFCSLYHFRKLHKRLLIVNGFSKSYAMSGWRVGFILSSRELIRRCLAFYEAMASGVSPVNQEAALEAWVHREALYKPQLEILRQNRALIMTFFRDHNIFFPTPKGAYYIFPDFSEYIARCCPDSRQVSSVVFCEKLKQETGIEVIPGDHFGAPNFARLSFAIAPEMLLEVLGRLNIFLRNYR
jgi:aspartate aminotransferase